MKNKILNIFFLLIILSPLLFSETLTIFYINDTHGHAWPFYSDGEKVGGYACLDAIFENEKAKAIKNGEKVLFLHAGDLNTGYPESDILNAAPDIVAFNMMGLDAMAVGNHEFDIDNDILKLQIKLSDFPFLSANIFDKTNERVFSPYLIKNYGNFKVAIIGVTTEETSSSANPDNIKNFQFKNVINEFKKVKDEIKDKNVDFLIALTHLGVIATDNATTSKALAQNINGIGLIVDGHSHTELQTPIKENNTYIVQAKCYGEYLGKIRLDIENGIVVNFDNKLIPVKCDNNSITPDSKIQKMLDYFKFIGSENLNNVIAKTKILLDGSRNAVRSGDTNLSHLITDAMKKKVNADISIINGGGIRESIYPGDITYKDVLSVLPFGNTIVVKNLTGNEIIEILKYAANVPDGEGAHLQTSGLCWVNNNGVAEEIKVNGVPIDKNKIYKVAMSKYLASGGDGYTMIKDIEGIDTGFVISQVVRDYLKQIGELTYYNNIPRYIHFQTFNASDYSITPVTYSNSIIHNNKLVIFDNQKNLIFFDLINKLVDNVSFEDNIAPNTYFLANKNMDNYFIFGYNCDNKIKLTKLDFNGNEVSSNEFKGKNLKFKDFDKFDNVSMFIYTDENNINYALFLDSNLNEISKIQLENEEFNNFAIIKDYLLVNTSKGFMKIFSYPDMEILKTLNTSKLSILTKFDADNIILFDEVDNSTFQGSFVKTFNYKNISDALINNKDLFYYQLKIEKDLKTSAIGYLLLNNEVYFFKIDENNKSLTIYNFNINKNGAPVLIAKADISNESEALSEKNLIIYNSRVSFFRIDSDKFYINTIPLTHIKLSKSKSIDIKTWKLSAIPDPLNHPIVFYNRESHVDNEVLISNDDKVHSIVSLPYYDTNFDIYIAIVNQNQIDFLTSDGISSTPEPFGKNLSSGFYSDLGNIYLDKLPSGKYYIVIRKSGSDFFDFENTGYIVKYILHK